MADIEEVQEKDIQIADLQKTVEMQKAEITRLFEEKSRIESDFKRLEAERDEMYKTLVIDHELAMERAASFHSEEIKRKDNEIESLKATIQKMRESEAHRGLENIELGTSTEEIRAGYEKEYKNKMQLLLAGMKEKKDEEIARVKKEAEFDIRLQMQKYVG
ncbi:unnamed protein product, partial [Gongylonema pulchrum]|uniref:Cilia- and flagella-associated protein 157 n=1 Tax=Gongylonema pulchrum TaxID=637853 RepID=A0A183DJL2_9BILA